VNGTMALSALFTNSGQPCYIVTRTASQTISTGSNVTITTLSTVELNQGNIGFLNGVFTVPSSGKYFIFYCIDWADNKTNTRNSNFLINNNTSLRRARVNIGGVATGNSGLYVAASDICVLSAGDTVQLSVMQNSGGNLSCITDATSDRMGIAQLF